MPLLDNRMRVRPLGLGAGRGILFLRRNQHRAINKLQRFL